MSLEELTQAYQHVAAQLAIDHEWAQTVEHSIGDHANWINH